MSFNFAKNWFNNNESMKASYASVNNSTGEVKKFYNKRKHFGMEFSYKSDDITHDDEYVLRGKLSCGHIVDPNSLTNWCQKLINDHHFEFHCPAIIDDSFKKCNKIWPYSEVKRMALLTKTEQDYFEIKLSENAAEKICDYKKCPKCKSFVERTNGNGLKTVCVVCLVLTKQKFEFCWQCEQKWIQLTSCNEADTCGRVNCINKKLQALVKCKFIQLENTNMLKIPSIRVCPTCGLLIEHDGTRCKNIICGKCKDEFCFSCLNLTSKCENSCKIAVPIQSTIPIWKKAFSL